jgi:hypothetical protein
MAVISITYVRDFITLGKARRQERKGQVQVSFADL